VLGAFADVRFFVETGRLSEIGDIGLLEATAATTLLGL